MKARTRFEVLVRDSHTCQYCGAAAPDARLHVDHVLPRALGGGDEKNNLITACADCNLGKGALDLDRLAGLLVAPGLTREPEEVIASCRSEAEAVQRSIDLSGLTLGQVGAQIGVSAQAVHKWTRLGVPKRRLRVFCKATGTLMVEQYIARIAALAEAA